ncbi:hypothetical protein BGZ61DRAFT_224539 [Ilyonectria robusta]|uniref:uncharacterized protein n=1 Tax=Ilyonectria robusta TaxID=1079257 RepID=UPI001E8CCDCF|nr:uncharacterized protein BGZ61DRAFT_224539 [Ilyonectria robusta]KAH8706622.1 hypothetical protein BGZ61DRAFT_224539 [Ilyonectria robusta]
MQTRLFFQVWTGQQSRWALRKADGVRWWLVFPVWAVGDGKWDAGCGLHRHIWGRQQAGGLTLAGRAAARRGRQEKSTKRSMRPRPQIPIRDAGKGHRSTKEMELAMAFLAASTKTASSQPDAEPLCSIPNKITQHFLSLKVPFAAFKMVIMTRLSPPSAAWTGPTSIV